MEGSRSKQQTQHIPLRRHSDITHTRPKTFITNHHNLPQSSSSRFACLLGCKGSSHPLYQCYRFKSMPVEKRFEKVKALRLCVNCLRKADHDVSNCTLGPCKVEGCSKMHNTYLHKPSEKECVVLAASDSHNNQSQVSQPDTHTQSNTLTLSSMSHNQILLSTALIGVADCHGKIHTVRVLLDNASTSSFITEELQTQLRLPTVRTSISVQGLNNQASHVTKRCDVTISSLSNSGYIRKIDCSIVPRITELVPNHKIKCTFEIPPHIHLADPDYDTPSEVQMLLSADIFWEVLEYKHIPLGPKKPILNATKLGWLVSGAIHSQQSNQSIKNKSFIPNHSGNQACHSSDPASLRQTHLIHTTGGHGQVNQSCQTSSHSSLRQTSNDRYDPVNQSCQSYIRSSPQALESGKHAHSYNGTRDPNNPTCHPHNDTSPSPQMYLPTSQSNHLSTPLDTYNTNITNSHTFKVDPCNISYCHFLSHSDSDLQVKLDRYFEYETINDTHQFTKDDHECEKIFANTTIRQDDGRFVVNIPFKQSPTQLGDSYDLALARYLALERRFSRDSVFQHKYHEFIDEYIQLGHMSENTTFNKDEISYFLPHHGVLRESSLTTKLRTVFDASARTTSGFSLNDLQLIGPTIQDDLINILIRFRQHKFVVTSDIEKMYRQILINESQRNLQQIFWRSCLTQQIKIYKLNTVTYGTASAPYLATRCLAQLGHDCVNKTVGNVILHDFYMDDLVTGSDSLSDLVSTCKGVIHELQGAHFHLRKWRSNNASLLHNIHNENSNDPLLILDKEEITKILGINWNCKKDELLFSYIPTNSNTKHTKRSILSTIAQIFDPLGLINPCLLQAKLILQKLWSTKISWDDELPTDLLKQWNKILTYLPDLETIQIPRRILCDNPMHVELHTFCDASIHAYAACVYVRSISTTGEVKVQLLIAKSRIAPFKRNMTIPRLELCGAVLAAQLTQKVKSSLRFNGEISTTYWTDSTIVLGWLKMSKSKLKQFVHNRINKITEITENSPWNHVPTNLNPADIGSRGLNPQQLHNSTLWYSGPEFLHRQSIQIPTQPTHFYPDLPETKVQCHVTVDDNFTNDFISKFSSVTKLQRVLAYMQRFIRNCRRPNEKTTGFLTTNELNTSTYTLCRLTQTEMFPDQYNTLINKRSLTSKDCLLSLTPFIQNDTGLIRVGGRLKNSNYDYDTKHPILLHAKHHYTQLLFEKYHKTLLHAGPQLLLTTIRQRFWVIGGRNLARKTVRNCVTCCRFSGKTIQPMLGNLPSERLQGEYPFYNSSCDYAGPILIANKKGRGCTLIKAYICVFVCLAVRAVHIELVTELSSTCYIAALERFIARRGKPRTIFSDNGKNFVGASNELSKFLKSNSNEISSYATEQNITFKFAPAYSPHFNGLAEGSIKSVKHHLKRVLGYANLTYEEMLTVLVQVEAILNSRPLTPMSSDPSDFVALTPAHFLIGRSLTMLPNPQTDDVPPPAIPSLPRYRRVQCLKAHFWKRYYKEYVSDLQQRRKWRSQSGERFQIGQLVIVKDDRLPPARWLLGRIIELHPGSDGITRVVDLRTPNGMMRRAFNRLVPLPILNHQDASRPAAC